MKVVTYGWLIENVEDPGEYLEHTPGDWGPQHSWTKHPQHALLFDTREEAMGYYEEHRSGLGYMVKYAAVTLEQVFTLGLTSHHRV